MARARARLRNQLPRLIGRRGWSDGDLAARTGLSREHVNRLKNGRVRPTLRDGLLISEASGLPIEAIFELADDGKP